MNTLMILADRDFPPDIRVEKEISRRILENYASTDILSTKTSQSALGRIIFSINTVSQILSALLNMIRGYK
jgi:hypothetical protein